MHYCVGRALVARWREEWLSNPHGHLMDTSDTSDAADASDSIDPEYLNYN
jgi:hypothetical protein